MPVRHRVAVLGGGSFGTVIANIVAANGHAVSLWMRNAEVARTVNAEHVNAAYLPDYPLHHGLRATSRQELLGTAINSTSTSASG